MRGRGERPETKRDGADSSMACAMRESVIAGRTYTRQQQQHHCQLQLHLHQREERRPHCHCSPKRTLPTRCFAWVGKNRCWPAEMWCEHRKTSSIMGGEGRGVGGV